MRVAAGAFGFLIFNQAFEGSDLYGAVQRKKGAAQWLCGGPATDRIQSTEAVT
jgi:hypothetical protein